jgi:hypothetical protein
MKIYIAHSTEFDFKKDLYQPIKSSRLNSEHEFIFLPKTYTEASDFVTRDIIKTCDLVIAEVSFPSTGLGIELGWADVFKCPIICIYKKGRKISDSLKVVTDNVIEYTDKKDLIDKVSGEVEVLENKRS